MFSVLISKSIGYGNQFLFWFIMKKRISIDQLCGQLIVSLCHHQTCWLGKSENNENINSPVQVIRMKRSSTDREIVSRLEEFLAFEEGNEKESTNGEKILSGINWSVLYEYQNYRQTILRLRMVFHHSIHFSWYQMS